MLVKTDIKKNNTAIIIKINKKKNDNLTENNKNNTKQTILYFDTSPWNACNIIEIHAVSETILIWNFNVSIHIALIKVGFDT